MIASHLPQCHSNGDRLLNPETLKVFVEVAVNLYDPK